MNELNILGVLKSAWVGLRK